MTGTMSKKMSFTVGFESLPILKNAPVFSTFISCNCFPTSSVLDPGTTFSRTKTLEYWSKPILKTTRIRIKSVLRFMYLVFKSCCFCIHASINFFNQSLKYISGTNFSKFKSAILYHLLNRLCPFYRGC